MDGDEMFIDGFIWLPEIIDKLAVKHRVSTDETEEVFFNGEDMGDVNGKTRTSISDAATLTEIGEYWDTHSLADHWDETHEVELEVRAERRRRVTLSPDVYSQVETRARRQGLLPETLVNLWLLERLQQTS